jgi:amino acid permease
VLILLVGWLSWFGLHFLNQCSALRADASYISIAQSAYGKRGERWLSLAQFSLLMGPLSAYFNIAGNRHWKWASS